MSTLDSTLFLPTIFILVWLLPWLVKLCRPFLFIDFNKFLVRVPRIFLKDHKSFKLVTSRWHVFGRSTICCDAVLPFLLHSYENLMRKQRFVPTEVKSMYVFKLFQDYINILLVTGTTTIPLLSVFSVISPQVFHVQRAVVQYGQIN